MIDTFDGVDPRWLAVDTAVMGILAWELANAPEPVGRRLSPTEAETLLKSSGVEGTQAYGLRRLAALRRGHPMTTYTTILEEALEAWGYTRQG